MGATQLAGRTSYTLDTRNRLTNIEHRDGAGERFAYYTFAYDEANRLTSEERNTTTRSFDYDEASQVTTDGSLSHSYDGTGNRTDTAQHQTVSGNRLTNDGLWTYTYDAEGNLEKKSKAPNDTTWTYGYDNSNQLIWVEKRASDAGTLQTRVDFKYDAFGQRIEKVVNGSTTRFAYDGDNVFADFGTGGSLTTRYLRGDVIDQIFARIGAPGGATELNWLLTDRQGSVREVLNATGGEIANVGYDGFGNVLGSPPAALGRYTWTGRERDVEIDLQYNRARYYDPATGRWIHRDPLGFDAGDSNLYRYVNNGPTNGTDPSGLWDYHGFFAEVKRQGGWEYVEWYRARGGSTYGTEAFGYRVVWDGTKPNIYIRNSYSNQHAAKMFMELFEKYDKSGDGARDVYGESVRAAFSSKYGLPADAPRKWDDRKWEKTSRVASPDLIDITDYDKVPWELGWTPATIEKSRRNNETLELGLLLLLPGPKVPGLFRGVASLGRGARALGTSERVLSASIRVSEVASKTTPILAKTTAFTGVSALTIEGWGKFEEGAFGKRSASTEALGTVTNHAFTTSSFLYFAALQLAERAPSSIAAESAAVRTNAQLVQEIATRSEAWGVRQGLTGTAREIGTAKHRYAQDLLTRYQNIFGSRGLSTEVRYVNQALWQPNAGMPTRGSVILDVVEGPLTSPTYIWDYKFGAAGLSTGRVNQIRGVTDFRNVPIIEVRP